MIGKAMKIIGAAIFAFGALGGILSITSGDLNNSTEITSTVVFTALFVFAAVFLIYRVIRPKCLAKHSFETNPCSDSKDSITSNSSISPNGNLPSENLCFEIRTQHIDVDADCPSVEGCPLSYLDASALRFWNKKTTDFQIPSYYSETAFGRNVEPARERLLEDGYLSLGSMEQRIALKTVPELKAILADKELKTSGKKQELVYRIIENFDPDVLEALFPINVYCITEKGLSALEPYSIVEESKSHSLGLSYYRLIQAKEANPSKSNHELLTQLLSEDIQQCYQNQDRSGYQAKITTTARFMQEIGEVQLSFECYSLSFFMWTRDLVQLGRSSPVPQSYYISKSLEEAGQLCGYDISQLKQSFQNVISQNNPFSLGTPDNIQYALRIFDDSLGIK